MSHMPFKAFMFKDVTSSTHVRTSYLIPGTSGWAPLFKYRRHWKRLNRNKSRKQNKMVTGVYSEMTGSSVTRLFKQAEKQTTQARQSYVRTVSIFANLSALSRIQKQFFILFSSYRFKKVASKIQCCEIPRLLLLNGREYFYVWLYTLWFERNLRGSKLSLSLRNNWDELYVTTSYILAVVCAVCKQGRSYLKYARTPPKVREKGK